MALPASSAARGRKAAPRNLKLLQGIAPGKDSGGRTVAPEIPFKRGALTKPENLSPDAAWLWDLVVEQLGTIGLLKPVDASSLEAVCECFARMREAVRWRQEHGLASKSSQGVNVAWWIKIESEASREFRSWCAEYGLTPAAEKNLRSEDGDDGRLKDNPFA
jgi:P27 family predicted phage terminase small subunit